MRCTSTTRGRPHSRGGVEGSRGRSWRRALDLTRELSREHTARLGVRTLDAMHVASALTLKRRVFVTYDERQAALARAVKLRVLAP